MKQGYSSEINVQVLISLLKQHGISRVVVSPGSTNVTFVASIQQDSFFKLYSCVDERSAAYMACGMAVESGEVVVLSCTGATASRNYFSALTEAYYRKIPVLVVTSSQDESRINHLIPQVIDRTRQPVDTIKMSVHLQNVKDDDDKWDCIIKANQAILELNHHGRGPVHVNLSTRYTQNYDIQELPVVRKIERITNIDMHPEITQTKVAIYVGSHNRWSDSEIKAIDAFCEKYNSVVFVDPTSNYTGKFKIAYDLVSHQPIEKPNANPDLLIHIGDMSDSAGVVGKPKEVWRVSEDGMLNDRYKALTYVFEMTELEFFTHYVNRDIKPRGNSYYLSCLNECAEIHAQDIDVPFSNIWAASRLSQKLPLGSTIHLGILSPLRSWSYFDIDKSIEVYCNQGGFGIDGNLSSLIGASIVCPQKLFFGVVGDLSFFYDMNSLGNRHVGNNLRILMVNNSLAAEFLLFKQANIQPVSNIEDFISARGHFGSKSKEVVKHYSEDMGFEYLSANSKEEFDNNIEKFVSPQIGEKPIVFELFTDVNDEDKALWEMWHIAESKNKKLAKKLIGDKGISIVKNILGK